MNARTIRAALVAGGLAVLLAGCGSAPQMLALDQACAADRDGSAVAVDGTVGADTAIDCNNIGGGDYRCSLDLVAAGGTKAGIEIAVGAGSDRMDEPPSSYTPGDLRIRAHDGSAVRAGDRVRASGKISTGPDVCFVTVDRLDRL